MKSIFNIILLGIIGTLFSCANVKEVNNKLKIKNSVLTTIYYGGDIVTVEGSTPEYMEAVAITDGKIIFTGKLEDAKSKYKKANLVDLKGKTMLPGLIDPHLHPGLGAILLQTDIIAFNDWDLPSGLVKGVSSPEGYLTKVTSAISIHKDKSLPYISWGYHPMFHGDLYRDDLDKLFPDTPVVLWHYSFHEFRMNSLAIEVLGIDTAAAEKHPQAKLDKGQFYEQGALTIIGPKIAPFVMVQESYNASMKDVVEFIHKGGVTLAGDMGNPTLSFEKEYEAQKLILDSSNSPFDVVVAPAVNYYSLNPDDLDPGFLKIEALPETYNYPSYEYVKQVKMFADGAFFSLSMQLNDGYIDGRQGEWLMDPNTFKKYAEYYWQKDYHIHVHCNGDKALDMVLNEVERLLKKYPKDDHRFTLHHLAFFTEEQAQRMSELNVIASINPSYFYLMEEAFAKEGIGEERARAFTPVSLLEKFGVTYTFHSDALMAPPEPLKSMWAAVARETLSGKTPSPEYAATAYEALKAITINAAFQLEKENEVGSIMVGKRANFTVVEKNPLKVDPSKIRDIKIYSTILDGIESLIN